MLVDKPPQSQSRDARVSWQRFSRQGAQMRVAERQWLARPSCRKCLHHCSVIEASGVRRPHSSSATVDWQC
eukprot:4040550-Amphidinium_carterae.1